MMSGNPGFHSHRTFLFGLLGCAGILLGHAALAQDQLPDFDVPVNPTDTEDLMPSLKADVENSVEDEDEPYVDQEPADAKQAPNQGYVTHHPLRQIKASIASPAGLLPKTRPVSDLPDAVDIIFDGENRPWAYSCFQWEAPATRSLPLLFEEPNLERLGYAYGCCDWGICEEEPRRGQRLQTFVSGIHFFGRIPFIPYMACVHPLTQPYYTLGVDRPGSPVPYRDHLIHCVCP